MGVSRRSFERGDHLNVSHVDILYGAEILHYPAGQVGTAHEKYLLTLGIHGFISKVDSSLS